jgi:hypothetical protein
MHRIMSTIFSTLALGAPLGIVNLDASAALVNITVDGTVGFNVIGGNQATVPDGAPVTMSFLVDSEVYVNSGAFPTRGYSILLDSFSLTVGGNPINILNPQQGNDPVYFVLRNNDPVADGFFISPGVDWPFPVDVAIPGLAPVHEYNFLATYGSGTELSSLNILDAVGTHTLAGITAYEWTVGKFGAAGAEYNYNSMTISVIPGPAGLSLALVLGGVGGRGRRRLGQ